MTPLKKVDKYLTLEEFLQHQDKILGINHNSLKTRTAAWNEHVTCDHYENDTYYVRHIKSPERLAIARHDKQPLDNWSAFQAIKNQILGEEVECVQFYPKESKLIDTANVYHLWVISGELDNIGFKKRRVIKK